MSLKLSTKRVMAFISAWSLSGRDLLSRGLGGIVGLVVGRRGVRGCFSEGVFIAVVFNSLLFTGLGCRRRWGVWK
jgi:hypothetical protein